MGLRTDKLTAKAQKITIKLPWEVTTIYSEALKQSGHQSDDEEDEDDLEAQEASLERLKVTPPPSIAHTIHLEPEP
jgi:transcription initiation protein SPT3